MRKSRRSTSLGYPPKIEPAACNGLQSFFHKKVQLETKPNNESVLIIRLPKLGAIDCNT